jgi:AbrB family looped-hinge helix DNA binding protein
MGRPDESISLLNGKVRRMESSAVVTSKGQVTIPAGVRAALGIRRGTRLLFHLKEDEVLIEQPGSGHQAVMRRFPDFFELAGSVPVPEALKDASWEEIRRRARKQRAARAR